MKKKMILKMVCFCFILIFLFSFVSAGFFDDFLNKILEKIKQDKGEILLQPSFSFDSNSRGVYHEEVAVEKSNGENDSLSKKSSENKSISLDSEINNPGLLEEWPIETVGWVKTGANVYDLDNDGDLEILQTVGRYPEMPPMVFVYALHHDGTSVDGWPVVFNTSDNQATSPVIGDINGDGQAEIIAMVGTQHLIALHSNGTLLDGFPFFYESVSASTLGPTISLSDLDEDGFPDILVPFGVKYLGNNEWGEAALFAINHNGQILDGWNKILEDDGESIWRTAIGNIDREEGLEVLAVSIKGSGSLATGKVYAWHHDGTSVDGWPKNLSSWGQGVTLADVDGDRDLEIFVSSLSDGKLYAWHHNGTSVNGWPQSIEGFMWGNPTIGDINKDSKPEIIIPGETSLYVFSSAGEIVDGWPRNFEDFVSGFPVLGDVNEDGESDIVVSVGRFLYAFTEEGEVLDDWPKPTGARIYSPALITDLEENGDLDVLVGSSDKKIYAWTLESSYNPLKMEWPIFQQNIFHTGVYAPPLCKRLHGVCRIDGECCKRMMCKQGFCEYATYPTPI